MNCISSRRPKAHELGGEYVEAIVAKVSGDCVLQAMEAQMYPLCELASSICAEQVDKIHSPFGWSVRQVFEHCANSERVSGYRILRLAAGDTTPLPGWNENQYADARFGLGNFGNLVTEISLLRRANLQLLRRIVPAAWDRMAEVDGIQISVRGIAWVAAGHLQHHLEIVARRCNLILEYREGPESNDFT